MENRQLYENAVEFASEAREQYLRARAENTTIDDEEWKRTHCMTTVNSREGVALGQKKLIAHLFGVDEARIDADITDAIWRRANARGGDSE